MASEGAVDALEKSPINFSCDSKCILELVGDFGSTRREIYEPGPFSSHWERGGQFDRRNELGMPINSRGVIVA